MSEKKMFRINMNIDEFVEDEFITLKGIKEVCKKEDLIKTFDNMLLNIKNFIKKNGGTLI